MSSGFFSKRNLAIIFGGALVLTVAIVAVATGLGHDSVPEGDVAVVDGNGISQEDFDRSLELAAKQNGLPAAPQPGDDQYDATRDQAIGLLLDIAWIEGEAEERGVEVTDTEVQQQFQQTKSQNFKTDAEYQKFLQQSGLTEPEVLDRVRLQLISQKIQDEVTAEGPAPSDSDLREFYDANKSQFEQPEQRTIRMIANKDPKLVDQALALLQQDNSPANWNKVAAQYSTDESSKDKGGVRSGITPGVLEQPLDDDIFNAEQGQVEGPVTTPVNTYAFQVDAITPGSTQSFDDVKDQLKQQLQGQTGQETFAAFLSDYRDRWTDVTICADDYLISRCQNFSGPTSAPCPDPSLPEEQQKAQLEQNGCPPAVLTISPGAPGSFKPLVPNVGGQPQRPHPPGEDQPAGLPSQLPGGVPGGAVPGGAQGAPPQGAPPQGAPPQGAAPPPGG